MDRWGVTVLNDGNYKEYEGNDKVCEHYILLGGNGEVFVEVVDVGDLIGQVYPLEAIEEDDAEEDDEGVGDNLSDG